MEAFRKFKPLKSTYGEFAVSLLKCTLSNRNRLKRTDVVLDVSKSNSIKDVERNKRSSGELSMQNSYGTCKSNSEVLYCHQMEVNKLVNFIVKQWISSSSLIGDKFLIVANNTEAYTIKSNNCLLIPELESNTKKLTQMFL